MEWEDKILEMTEGDLDKKISSKEVPRDMLQAVEETLVIVGCDVEQLYPSMKKEQVARIMEEAIRKTDIKWMDLDYMEGCRFIALNKTQEWCIQSKLRRVLPRRRGRVGGSVR